LLAHSTFDLSMIPIRLVVIGEVTFDL